MIQRDLQSGTSEVVEARFPVEVGGWFDLHVVSHCKLKLHKVK
jgi:hypothetical protein